jgi:nicotinamide mononucleotide adenylyltransferase
MSCHTKVNGDFVKSKMDCIFVTLKLNLINMQYNLFIGRYQSPHKGHQAIFDKYLKRGLPVLIAVRDVIPDANNPLNADEVKQIWDTIYKGNELVKTIVIPDIVSVNYGRNVGYEIKCIDTDATTAMISATAIRSQILSGEQNWKNAVDEKAHEKLERFLTLSARDKKSESV